MCCYWSRLGLFGISDQVVQQIEKVFRKFSHMHSIKSFIIQNGFRRMRK